MSYTYGMSAPATRIPDQHAEMIAMLRTCAANSPESLRECVERALADYEASGAWQNDVDPYAAYE